MWVHSSSRIIHYRTWGQSVVEDLGTVIGLFSSSVGKKEGEEWIPLRDMDHRLIGHSRHIPINQRTDEVFSSNVISTTKYNVVTFLPRFLLEQFRRYSNVFFLVIALLQQIPEVSPTGRYTTAVPFLIILTVSALKEIFEDLKRTTSDQKVNSFPTHILDHGHWTKGQWKDVCVGQVLRIEDNELFPADLLLLASSEPQAMAYIETSNLDGETNLKIRQGLEITSSLISLERLVNFSGEIECEVPNRHVNDFTGTLRTGVEQKPIGINQILLRGARLKNTPWIFGVVVYTGHDTKLMMNSKTAPLKMSTIDITTNKRIIFLFIILLILALVSAIGAQYYFSFALTEAWYVKSQGNFAWNFLTFFILYNNLIPISLQVTLEIVRFFQATYINNDILMYDEASDTTACARTSNLNEELGQVKFVLSDKTGTLTRNVMKFKRCSIAGHSYGNDEGDSFDDLTVLDHLSSNNDESNDIREFLTAMAICHTVVPERRPYDIWPLPGDESNDIREFLTAMAICHTIVPERDVEGKVRYQASSPDEGALVKGAALLQFVFHTRTPQHVTVQMMGRDETFQVLNVLEFTSDRKRMAVIVKTIDGLIKLYIKGADSTILERLTPDSQHSVEVTKEHLVEFAAHGYRTLCFAMTQLDEGYYLKWAEDFAKASIAIEDREKRVSIEAEKVERDLKLLGATAIEDKLQEDVAETIEALLAADMRVWMLTGDKRETAINIAQSSSLCQPGSSLLIVDCVSYDETFERMERFIPQAIAMEQSLKHALTGEARMNFSRLATICHSVVCCRMTPMQKAEVVEMVRALGDIVVAVGDGANDVAMIQAANVGIGISGQEGLQAASASDYSIAQFKFLSRLLLVHGAWNFDRSVKVILYSFYKNICLYLIELWFALFSAFSGQTIFERWTIAMFNVIFTAWPPVILGLFDRPVSAGTILRYPALYCSFQRRAFSETQFWLWIVMAIGHSLLLFFLSYLFFGNGIDWANGRTGGWLMLGNACYTYVVATVSAKAILEADAWSAVLIISCVGSLLLWLFFLAIYSVLWPTLRLGSASDMAGMGTVVFSSASFWFGLLLIPTLTLLLDFVYKSLRATFHPTPRELACLEDRRRKPVSLVNNSNYSTRRSTDSRGRCYDNRGVDAVDEERGSTELVETRHLARSPDRHGEQTVVTVTVPKPSLTERARLITKYLVPRNPHSFSTLERQSIHGYAFSQEELGVVSQRELIRNYDSTRIKPPGV